MVKFIRVNAIRRGGVTRIWTVFFVIMLTLFSTTDLSYAAYRDKSSIYGEMSTLEKVTVISFACILPAYTAYDIHKVKKLSKKPVLFEKDYKFLRKRTRWGPISGGVCLLGGVSMFFGGIRESSDNSDPIMMYTASGIFILSGVLFFVDAIEARRVLSQHQTSSKR